MKHSIRVLVFCSILLFVTAALAQDKVVVIPLNSAKKLDNVVTVSAKGGDFTDPVAAVNSITAAAAANPYLVVIGPGVYTLTQTLVMQPYVSIAGSGQEVTKLTGAFNSDTSAAAAVVAGADNATLRDLTVENTGGPGGTYAVALHNSDGSPSILDVTATASGGVFTAGVFNSLSAPIMNNVTARASGGFGNIGVYNLGSAATMDNVTASALGGVENYGVWNVGTPSATMTNVTAIARHSFGTTLSYGVYNSSSSSLNLRNCKADGDTRGIYVAAGSTVRVMQSSILNNITVEAGGTLTCVTSDNGVNLALGLNCLPAP